MATCPTSRSGEHCWEWARVYINYCICSARDQASFALGFISVISWGIAEIPQIITNYKEKSVDGLSLGFLITWMIGDIFNIFGCILEPATLPTQYYMAILYTMTTLILTAQTVYYGHIYPRLKSNSMFNKGSKEHQPDTVENFDKCSRSFGVKRVFDSDRFSSPIPLPAINGNTSPGRELYYMSARSLSSSHTPTAGSFLAQRMTPPLRTGNLVEEPLLSGHISTQSTPPSTTKSLLCLVSALLFIGSFNFQLSTFHKLPMGDKKINQGFVIPIGRKLLEVNAMPLGENGHGEGGWIGTFLGWAMAAIYMGGRLPQICLNIRRGNVEGLNPFMFIFALVGNSTYVASILVKSMDWSKIRPNLPWLVDAGGCVLLDSFILIQFIYFCYWEPQNAEDKHGNFGQS